MARDPAGTAAVPKGTVCPSAQEPGQEQPAPGLLHEEQERRDSIKTYLER